MLHTQNLVYKSFWYSLVDLFLILLFQSVLCILCLVCNKSLCRDFNKGRTALFDGIEEGGIRASSSYTSHEIDEHENERAIDGLQDRVNVLKRVSDNVITI